MADYKKSVNQQTSESHGSFLARPEIGTALTIASGFFFLLLGMLLPLVGKAGAHTVHYGKNYASFLLVLLITITLSGLSIKSKLDRRKVDGSPLPRLSMTIGALCLILLLALFAGLLKI